MNEKKAKRRKGEEKKRERKEPRNRGRRSLVLTLVYAEKSEDKTSRQATDRDKSHGSDSIPDHLSTGEILRFIFGDQKLPLSQCYPCYRSSDTFPS